MSVIRFTLLVLLLASAWIVGCAVPKPVSVPNPLEGWSFYGGDNLNKTITDDYQNYIHELPPEERYYVPGGLIRFFENGTGQHAVKIEIPLNGVYKEHVLIYDKNDQRIKVVVYLGGRYAS